MCQFSEALDSSFFRDIPAKGSGRTLGLFPHLSHGTAFDTLHHARSVPDPCLGLSLSLDSFTAGTRLLCIVLTLGVVPRRGEQPRAVVST